MIFIDSSAYLSLLIPTDNNREKASRIFVEIAQQKEEQMTSYGVLAEVLTIGSMRFNRKAAIVFVADVYTSGTKIVMENEELIQKTFKIFEKITDKDVSWVDCYSFAIVEQYKVAQVFSFDKDFKKYAKAKILA